MPGASGNHFLLVGSAPFTNRGCEAIIRGTITLLREEFGCDCTFTLASHGFSAEIRAQAASEFDKTLKHIDITPSIWSKDTISIKLNNRFGTHLDEGSRMLNPHSSTTLAALQVGGDNYSLYYCVPWFWIRQDIRLRKLGLPVVLWGASVGPFGSEPKFADVMFEHLKALDAISVREPVTAEYLAEHGIRENVHRVCDPSFLMEPEQPPKQKLPQCLSDQPVGLNLMPMQAAYVTACDMGNLVRMAAEAVQLITQATGRSVLLIPHATSRNDEFHDDYRLLKHIYALAATRVPGKVELMSDDLSAAETRWVISKCALFAGARMQAVVSAISAAVPTLSFLTSDKLLGLNEDVFGTQEHCLMPKQQRSGVIAERVTQLLADRDAVNAQLTRRVPQLQAGARQGARVLRNVVESRSQVTGNEVSI